MDILFLLVGRKHWSAALRCCGSRRVHSAIQILGLLLRWFQDLQGKFAVLIGIIGCSTLRDLTWNEHISVSSTVIMPPALSNSPQ